MSTKVLPGTYAKNRPILIPDSLNLLRGPVAGRVRLNPFLDWGPDPVYDLDDPADLRAMYATVLREALRYEDLHDFINADILHQVWADLNLPHRVRQRWEHRFPTLLS